MAPEPSKAERIIAILGDLNDHPVGELERKLGADWRKGIDEELRDYLRDDGVRVYLDALPTGYKYDAEQRLLYRVISSGRTLEIQRDGSVKILP